MNTFDGWDNELYHYGILGMKWGIRRYQNEDGTLTPAGRKRRQRQERKEAKKAEKLERKKEKKPKLYSPEELEARIKRLELEKRYKDLYRDIRGNAATRLGKELVEKTLMDAENIGALALKNTVNWWTEKTPLERVAGAATKGAEALGNLVGNTAKIVNGIKSGGNDDDGSGLSKKEKKEREEALKKRKRDHSS